MILNGFFIFIFFLSSEILLFISKQNEFNKYEKILYLLLLVLFINIIFHLVRSGTSKGFYKFLIRYILSLFFEKYRILYSLGFLIYINSVDEMNWWTLHVGVPGIMYFYFNYVVVQNTNYKEK
jgi:hypothetical protein